jgi:hypothetical protein
MRCGVFVDDMAIFVLNFIVGLHFGSVRTGCSMVCTYCRLLTLFAAEVNSSATFFALSVCDSLPKSTSYILEKETNAKSFEDAWEQLQ